MAKEKTIWVCSECGNEAVRWMGKCPSCNAWDSLYEQKQIKTTSKSSSSLNGKRGEVIKLKEAPKSEYTRKKTGFKETDRVLGGGLVNGSLTLIGGEPGIGKSTLILQICDFIAREDKKILYVSGEESAEQILLRAERLGINNDNIYFFGETEIESVEAEILRMNPEFCVIDSMQTMYSSELSSAAGSVSQVREITAKVMNICKKNNITTVIVGHVTKDGNIAGPRVLEHMVDTVLYLEGEKHFSYRILKAVKNRFGSTEEIGIFEMCETGLKEVLNPSSVLIDDRKKENIGTIVAPSIEGSRVILVELQSLTTRTIFGMPRRNANGIDLNRLNLLLAVIEKYTSLALSTQDVYLNVTGGIKISEPAIDLSIIVAVISSYLNKNIESTIAAVGEVGLTGEIRNVTSLEKRIQECEKMGFKKILVPKKSYNRISKEKREQYNITVIPLTTVKEILDIF